ncbi:jerky protein homolog-like [Anthonomus grandis grandis]|uniref:jerky protein homolog-like n=1 Tax=Anthonomus grandis grandis TaxID=2921223 RepID=UPI002165AC61|nr:jerky protein homolog-like [Anthonomus grandis grandis]
MQRTGANEKRKRNVLTIEQKMEILKQSENNISVAILAKTYNIGKQTVRDIVKKKSQLQSFVAKADSAKAISDRKPLKGSTFRELDDAMTKWFLQKRSVGVPISGPMCTRQAEKFHKFKKRRGIRELAVQGEKLSANEVAMVEFCYDLENLIIEHDLKPEQVYNGDETGLYWKAMPRRTLVVASETSAPGFKVSKDRLTVLCCANASGTHKLRLAVIGKSKNPRAFKNIKRLPVDYYNQKAAWMDRAVLLLDNAPSHPDVEQLNSTDGNILVAYFPPNVTSIAQPMDQGVIETMKRLYRKDLMLQLLGEDDIVGFWKRLNLKEAIYAVARAWSDVKVDHIKKSFYKIMTLEHEDGSEDENHLNEGELSVGNIATIASQIKGLEEIDNKEIQEWIECDHQETGYQIINDDYLHNKSSAESSDKSSDENESSDKNDCVIMTSHREARDAVNILIQYFEEQPVTNDIHVAIIEFILLKTVQGVPISVPNLENRKSYVVTCVDLWPAGTVIDGHKAHPSQQIALPPTPMSIAARAASDNISKQEKLIKINSDREAIAAGKSLNGEAVNIKIVEKANNDSGGLHLDPMIPPIVRLSRKSGMENDRYLLARLRDPLLLKSLRLYLAHLHDTDEYMF